MKHLIFTLALLISFFFGCKKEPIMHTVKYTIDSNFALEKIVYIDEGCNVKGVQWPTSNWSKTVKIEKGNPALLSANTKLDYSTVAFKKITATIYNNGDMVFSGDGTNQSGTDDASIIIYRVIE